MINFLKNILPPFVVKVYKKYAGYILKAQWEYLPNGFNTKIKSDGWDLQSIVDLQVSKWELFKNAVNSLKPLGINHESNNQQFNLDLYSHNTIYSYAYVLLLSSHNKSSIKILDWGGGIGHYGIISDSLLKPIKINIKYNCYDLSKFCIAGSKLNPNYTYFDNTKSALNNNYDLIIASSSLWYEQDWKETMLNLANSTNEYLYITRMNFISKKESYVAVQRPSIFGYNTEYMCWIINENEFIAHAKKIGLELIREIYIGHSFPIFKAPEQGHFKGFIFKKNI